AFFLLLLALGGLYGGIAMLTDPTGNLLQLTEVLPLLPMSDYTLPGLFLLIVMGLVPLLLTYALLARPNWTWAETLFGWSGHHWAWTGTLGLGVTLEIWLLIQGLLIGFMWPIQYVTAADGFLIVILALAPGVRRLYAKQRIDKDGEAVEKVP
ncbi:MAG: hypothetical protein PVJ86_14905, partial [Phycisphaerales bacterium]